MKNKVLIFIGLIFMVFISSIQFVSALEKEQIHDKAFLRRNEKLTLLAEKIDTLLKNDNNIYPDYYGGMYINDDSTNLIFQIVENNIPDEKSLEYSTYEKIINISDKMVIEYVKYPYDKLQKINNEIVEYYKAVDYVVNRAEFKKISSIHTDIKNNTVVVGLLKSKNLKEEEYAEELQILTNDFKKYIIDDEAITFFLDDEITLNSTIKAGQGIITYGTSSDCSMGYRAKLNGHNGFITSGHCAINGTYEPIGAGEVKKWKMNGTVDAAFVQTYSSYTPSNNLNYISGTIVQLSATASCPVLFVGSAVARVGMSTHYVSGTITELSHSHTLFGLLFTDLGLTSYSGQSGDSGGPVFSTASGGPQVPLVGIHMGTITTNSGATNSVYVKEDNIAAAFGYTRY